MSKITKFRIVYQEVKTSIASDWLDADGNYHLADNAERDLATYHCRHYCSEAVSVEIRRWSHFSSSEYATNANDVVLHCIVVVAGQQTLDERTPLDSALSDAQLQRIGIARYDELLRSHPTLFCAED